MLLAGSATAQPSAAGAAERPYRIECAAPGADVASPGADAVPCRADVATFIGRRVFAEFCVSCHASDGLGSRFAPALPERVRGLSRAEFMTILERGYDGEAAVLPRWGEIADVRRYSEELWVYLLARANGALPPGPVELLPESPRP